MAHGSADIDARLKALHEQSDQHRDDARRAAEQAHAELLAERKQAMLTVDAASEPPSAGPNP